MAGSLLETLLGKDNGFANWAGDNSGLLTGLGTSLLSSGMNFAPAQAGAAMDVQAAQQRDANAKVAASTQATSAALRKQGFNDLADAVDANALPPSDAWNEGFRRMSAKTETPKPLEINGQLVDPNTYQVIGDYRDPASTPTPTLTSIYTPDGMEQKGYMQGTQFVPVGGPKAPEFNASQATAAGYADRMMEADAIVSDPKFASVQTDPIQATKGATPVIGNFMTSPEFQQADQAQRNFINAILRRESGAVISDDEFANARKQYFPQPGDSPLVLAQKAANRKNAIKGVARSAGPAYDAQPGVVDDPLGIR